MQYPPKISDEDLGVSGETPAPHAPLQPAMSDFADRRLRALRGSEEPVQLMHTDSGFDEHMVEELALDEPAPGEVLNDDGTKLYRALDDYQKPPVIAGMTPSAEETTERSSPTKDDHDEVSRQR
jgi:hypothetical protein